MSGDDRNVAAIFARLAEAAEAEQPLELILVLRGTVRPAAGTDRWRIRLESGRVLTFSADAIAAATAVPPPPAGQRR